MMCLMFNDHSKVLSLRKHITFIIWLIILFWVTKEERREELLLV